MARTLPLLGGLATLLAAGVVIAGTPFGGDDTGFISSVKSTLKCETAIGKAVGKAVACIDKCTLGVGLGTLTIDEDACEKNNGGKSCLEKFVAAATKAQSGDTTGGCGCVSVTNLANFSEVLVDSSLNGLVYCDGSSHSPFGGDDTGFLPAGNSAGVCENTVNKLVSKAVACVITCHAKRASGKLKDDAAEDACEKNNGGKSCLEKFVASVANVSGCPACLNSGNIGALIESQLDSENGFIYCASPSGAFLD